MRRHWIHYAAMSGFGGYSNQYRYLPGLFDKKDSFICGCLIVARFSYNLENVCTSQHVASMGFNTLTNLSSSDTCQALVKLQQQFPVDIDPDLMEDTTDPELLAVIRENIRLFR